MPCFPVEAGFGPWGNCELPQYEPAIVDEIFIHSAASACSQHAEAWKWAEWSDKFGQRGEDPIFSDAWAACRKVWDDWRALMNKDERLRLQHQAEEHDQQRQIINEYLARNGSTGAR